MDVIGEDEQLECLFDAMGLGVEDSFEEFGEDLDRFRGRE